MTDTEDKFVSVKDALLDFHRNMPDIQKTKDNPDFKGAKYVPLDEVMDAVIPMLEERELLWVCEPDINVDTSVPMPILRWKLVYLPNGTELTGDYPLLLDKQNAQGMGSAITYARRYALMCVLGLVADEDDDGNAASGVGDKGKDASRPAAPTIPLDRAKAILATAQSINLAEDTTLVSVFKAKLASVGAVENKIALLTVDQAEDVEAWLAREAERVPS